MNKKEKRICPVCGEEMEEYKYAYDHNELGKKYYKCYECGHKENTLN